METLVMYYSLTGRTRYEATRIAESENAELYEVREQRHRKMANAYLFGPSQARARRFVYIEPIAIDLEEFDKIIIACPVWGGYPAPAFNNIVSELPPEKEVEIVLTSDSGKSKAKVETITLVEMQGVHVSDYRVIKTEDLHKRDIRHAKRAKAEAKQKKKLEKQGKLPKDSSAEQED